MARLAAFSSSSAIRAFLYYQAFRPYIWLICAIVCSRIKSSNHERSFFSELEKVYRLRNGALCILIYFVDAQI